MEREVQRRCKTHGITTFILEGRGYYRCKTCRKERVAQWRRRAKLRLVEEAGGRCVLCGYDRYSGALHFHHIDPSQKRFGLGARGRARAIATLREEAAKCVLLCSNCHAEVEWGMVKLDLGMVDGSLPETG
jgi:5-methylcytosine-specific restriction endonuclease McrA